MDLRKALDRDSKVLRDERQRSTRRALGWKYVLGVHFDPFRRVLHGETMAGFRQHGNVVEPIAHHRDVLEVNSVFLGDKRDSGAFVDAPLPNQQTKGSAKRKKERGVPFLVGAIQRCFERVLRADEHHNFGHTFDSESADLS